jgi:AcrR family transcriptional regulator
MARTAKSPEAPAAKSAEARGANTQSRIVDAAITCIEKEGLQGVTIRGIARTAGVNSAAISYYFRSKDKLVEEALKTTLANAFEDWETLLRSTDNDFRETLKTVLTELFEGARGYPGLVKAHLYDSFVHGTYTTLFVRRFNEFLAVLSERREKAAPKMTDAALVQMLSAVLFPGVFAGLFRKSTAVGLSDSAARAGYVDDLVQRYFPEPRSRGLR